MNWIEIAAVAAGASLGTTMVLALILRGWWRHALRHAGWHGRHDGAAR